MQTDVDGREHATQLEQVESELTWRRDGSMRQHVVGYRSRGGLSLSALTLLHRPWIVPTLYGDRLRPLLRAPLLEGMDDDFDHAVHPLSAGRDSVYRFSGGDTVLVLGLEGRAITVVRVHVEPRPNARAVVGFRGDLDVAAESKRVLRMRGQLEEVGERSRLSRVRRAAIRRLVFVDVQNAELGGRFWLPLYERVDVQIRSGLSDDFHPGFRAVTRFRDVVLDTLGSAAFDRGEAPHEELTFAPGDSLDEFGDWDDEIGAATTLGAATDFDDVLRVEAETSSPRLAWDSERVPDVFRYDKVEGFYTGAAALLTLRDGSPHVDAALHGGWGWAESVPRGGVALRVRGGAWRTELSARRELDNTNDFVPALEGPATLSALLVSIDDYDYVDRAAIGLSLTRFFDARGTRSLRIEVGPGRDASVRSNVQQGLFLLDTAFRANRSAAAGSYWRESVALEINPGVSGEFLEPGVGFGLSYERGDGEVAWQRVDARLTALRTLGRWTVGGRLDGASVFGGFPPQRLVEFGENEGMPGYGYKDFGGDRAALGRVMMGYSIPFLQRPVRLFRRLVLPSASPAVTLALQGGWADAIAPATRAALASFGTTVDDAGAVLPATRPTKGVRSSVAIAIDFFGGAMGVGVARPLEAGRGWTFILGSQQW